MTSSTELSEVQKLLEPGEELGAAVGAAETTRPDGEPTSEHLYGFEVAPIENSTHAGGSSVLIEIEPGGAVEPVLITGDITRQVKALRGCGAVVMYSLYKINEVQIIEFDTESEPVELVSGDAYACINRSETDPLTLRGDCTPAFEGFEEFQLAVAPIRQEESDDKGVLAKHPVPDGRSVTLPIEFWRAFIR